MKKLIIILSLSGMFLACDSNKTNNNNFPGDKTTENEADGVNANGEWDHTRSYTFDGPAIERKTTFENVSADLQMKLNSLSNQHIDDDVMEKVEEANEKIADAREKIAKADQKSLDGNTEDAQEKIEEAREKLDEAREKYMEALEKLGN